LKFARSPAVQRAGAAGQAQFGFGPGRDCSTLQAAGNVDDDYRHGAAWFAPVYTAEYYEMPF